MQPNPLKTLILDCAVWPPSQRPVWRRPSLQPSSTSWIRPLCSLQDCGDLRRSLLPAVARSAKVGPALRDPAGQGGPLPDPRRHLRLVERVVLADVEVAYFLVLGLARGDRTQRRAAEERHLDVVREGMEVEEPALALDP